MIKEIFYSVSTLIYLHFSLFANAHCPNHLGLFGFVFLSVLLTSANSLSYSMRLKTKETSRERKMTFTE